MAKWNYNEGLGNYTKQKVTVEDIMGNKYRAEIILDLFLGDDSQKRTVKSFKILKDPILYTEIPGGRYSAVTTDGIGNAITPLGELEIEKTRNVIVGNLQDFPDLKLIDKIAEDLHSYCDSALENLMSDWKMYWEIYKEKVLKEEREKSKPSTS